MWFVDSFLANFVNIRASWKQKSVGGSEDEREKDVENVDDGIQSSHLPSLVPLSKFSLSPIGAKARGSDRTFTTEVDECCDNSFDEDVSFSSCEEEENRSRVLKKAVATRNRKQRRMTGMVLNGLKTGI